MWNTRLPVRDISGAGEKKKLGGAKGRPIQVLCIKSVACMTHCRARVCFLQVSPLPIVFTFIYKSTPCIFSIAAHGTTPSSSTRLHNPTPYPNTEASTPPHNLSFYIPPPLILSLIKYYLLCAPSNPLFA